MQNKRVEELYLGFKEAYKNNNGKCFHRLCKKSVILKESEWDMLANKIKKNYKVKIIINKKEHFKISLF